MLIGKIRCRWNSTIFTILLVNLKWFYIKPLLKNPLSELSGRIEINNWSKSQWPQRQIKWNYPVWTREKKLKTEECLWDPWKNIKRHVISLQEEEEKVHCRKSVWWNNGWKLSKSGERHSPKDLRNLANTRVKIKTNPWPNMGIIIMKLLKTKEKHWKAAR